MSSKVGAKGNIVIDKSIRDQLGVQPGWETVQLLRDGHVEVHFLPPVQAGASAGMLQRYTKPGFPQFDEELDAAIEESYAAAAVERYDRTVEPEPGKPREKESA